MIKHELRNIENVGLSSPWVEYYHNLNELFSGDPDVELEYSEEECKVTMRVNGNDKYAALCALIPEQKQYGETTLKINVVPANRVMTTAQLFDDAFEGNANYAFTQVVQSPMMSNPMTFVVFRKKVAQFFNDNLGDLFGNKNTLYQDIVKEVLNEQNGVFFCTDKE